jgi:hypothetical protein
MAVDSKIIHKTTKASLDKGYASEWNDSHNIPSGTAFPGDPVEGQFFYRSDEHILYCYNGTTWKAFWS